ncbi:hypothetical protein CDV26_04870 [Francisella halioticida]|uniref:HTH marR-type domain-containing protein n=1 Tax=Francisella halioticida TaxID=549298 RepID=A0ABM6LYR1_9GAMM|nr:hypothetical protein CDV26_04870 [Francisella halioticida]
MVINNKLQLKLPPQKKLPKIKLSHLLLLQATKIRRKLNLSLTEKCNLTLSEKEVLAQVYKHEGKIRMSDISNKLLFTDGGTTKIIKRLASRGLIKQERSNKDKRVIFIDITSIGVNKLSDALDTMVSVACPLIEETFTLYECKTLTKLLEKFENTIQYLQTN